MPATRRTRPTLHKITRIEFPAGAVLLLDLTFPSWAFAMAEPHLARLTARVLIRGQRCGARIVSWRYWHVSAEEWHSAFRAVIGTYQEIDAFVAWFKTQPAQANGPRG